MVAELLVTSVSIAIINVSKRFMAHGGMLLKTSSCSPMNADNPDFCEKKFPYFLRMLYSAQWFVIKMVLHVLYMFALFKDNLFAFPNGHIIARNLFKSLTIHHLRKNFYYNRTLLPHMHQRGHSLLLSTIKLPMETSSRLWASLK